VRHRLVKLANDTVTKMRRRVIWQTVTAAGRLARGLGRRAHQPGLCRPLPAPDHPRTQQTQTDQAQTVVAASILRQLHAVITTGQRCDPLLATHGTRTLQPTTIAA
jgi:hypothetical protein